MSKFSGDYMVVGIDQENVNLEDKGVTIKVKLTETHVFFSEVRLNSYFLFPGTEITLDYESTPRKIDIKPSPTCYLFTIYQAVFSNNKPHFLGKKNYDESKKKLNFKNCVYQDSHNPVRTEEFQKLIGQIIFVNSPKKKDKKTGEAKEIEKVKSKKVKEHKKSYKVLLNNEENIKELPEATNFSLKDLGNGTIESKTFAVFGIKSDLGIHYWVLIPDFYNNNNIPIETDTSNYVGKRVKVQMLVYLKRPMVTLLPEKPKSTVVLCDPVKLKSENKLELKNDFFGSAEFSSSTKRELKYNDSQKISRCPLTDVLRKNAKIQKEIAGYYASPQIFNKSLGLVVGLAFFEHLFRFPSDKNFKDFFEKKLTQFNCLKLYLDLSIQARFKTFEDFYSFFNSDFITNIKRIGEEYIERAPHDIETLEGIQDLCNLTGCCIHFHDFTEGFKQLKLVPINYELNKRPIIRLGKYFDDYFLIYSPDQMKKDEYNIPLKDRKKTIGTDIDKKCFPYYDAQKSAIDTNLDGFLFSIAKKINENIENYIAKLTGNIEKTLSINIQDDVTNFGNFLFMEDIEISKNTFDELNKINFSNVLYYIQTVKYTCGCCLQSFIEKQNPKHKTRLNCGHDFCEEHILNNLYQQCFICTAKNSSKASITKV